MARSIRSFPIPDEWSQRRRKRIRFGPSLQVCQYAHFMDRATREALGDVGALALLVIRGLLLWILIPVGLVLWLFIFGWSARVGLGTFLGWLDLNLTVALQRILVQCAGRARCAEPGSFRCVSCSP